ncbi:unnamed protein product [Adineta steineri]|uniref:Uncharacterized protein n=1 Tax=Adineta steineri TaxID=433720 RepID=A0A814IBW4_9BILA|nr:unnamed protein product [Adineta steineri]
MLLFNPNTAIRVIVISVLVGVLVSVVAASIAIGIIATKYFRSSQLIVRADIYVALDRLVASYERDVLYSRRQTLHDIIGGLNTTFSQAFPGTFFKLVITAFSGKPILITDLSKKKRQYDHPSIVTVNGTVYFVANYTGNDILNALKNYSQMITLVTVDGKPSTKLATFSTLYSTSTDTYAGPDSRSKVDVEKLLSIDVTDPTTTTSTSTLSTLTNTTTTYTTSTTTTSTTSTTSKPTINTTTILTTNTATTSTINSTTIPTINTTAIPAINITISPTTNTTTSPTTNTATIPTINTTTISTTNIIPTTPITNTTTTATIPSTTMTIETTAAVLSTTIITETTTTNTTSTCKPIFAMNITVALERWIYPNELPQFYDRYNLRLGLFDGIHDQIEEYFSNHSITFTMIDMSDEPVLIPDSMLEGTDEVGTDQYAYDSLPTEKPTTKKSIVIIHGELLSKEYITAENISNAFQDFTASIILITPGGESSRYSSSFDNEYSSFQNMSQVEFTDGNTNFSICYNSSCGTFTFHSTPFVRNTTTSSNSATQSVFKADIRLYLDSNTTGYSSSLSYNTSYTLNSIFTPFLLYFPETLLTVVISNITDNSSLNNVNSRKKREADEALLSIAVNASVYFLLDHTKEEIINAFQDYSLLIYATTDSGEPIVAAGNVSMNYSTFTDTYLTQIPRLENTIGNCIYLA